jgi:hypothetical protein
MRDFNSTVARAVTRYQKDYSGGRLWARRYSADFLAGDDSVEDYFFYTVLQPVKDGLVDDIKDYPGYNCFEDAITGQARKYKVVKWKQYNDAKRWNPEVSIEEFTEYCTLRYSRLPGYEHLSKAEYEALMRTKLKERTAAMVAGRTFSGSVGPQKLRLVKPGSIPKKTKKSGPKDHRPRVLSKDPNRRSEAKAWYFDTVFEHHRCSLLYRAGDLTVQFPEGTYKPPMFTVAYTGVLG